MHLANHNNYNYGEAGSSLTCPENFCILWNLYFHCGQIAQSVYQLTTGWTVQDRVLVGTRFSTRPGWPWGPPSLLCNGYRVFPRGKVQLGRASIAAVMEE